LPTLRDETPRIPALEILLGTPIVTKYILEGREGELLDVIIKSHEEGMIDLNSALLHLVESEWVSLKIALEATPKPEDLKMKLKGIA
jgi:Tfp pilus assembly pilus retraction ATPase PilT